MPADITPNHLRRSHRINLPATIVVDGVSHRVDDWSFEGFRIADAQGIQATEQQVLEADFVLPNQSYNLSFQTKAKVAWRDGAAMGFEFVEIPPHMRQALHEYASATVAGQADTAASNHIYANTSEKVVPPTVSRPLEQEERKDLNNKLARNAIGYLLLALLMIALLVLLLSQQHIVDSVSGLFVQAPSHQVRSNATGRIESVAAQTGGTISSNEILLTVGEDRAVLDTQISQAQQVVAARQQAQNAVLDAIEDLKADADAYQAPAPVQRNVVSKAEREHAASKKQQEVIAAQQRLANAQWRSQQLRTDVADAEASLQRLQQLQNSGFATGLEVERAQREVVTRQQAANQYQQQVSLAEQMVQAVQSSQPFVRTRSSYQSRSYQGGSGRARAAGAIASLRAQAAQREVDVRKAELKLAELQTQVTRYDVRADRAGIVQSVAVSSGQMVERGQVILTLAPDTNSAIVRGRFKFSDALKIKPGQKAKVYFASADKKVGGVVTQVGEPGESESHLREPYVTVLVRMNDVPAEVTPGLRAAVAVETKSWFKSLFSRKD